MNLPRNRERVLCSPLPSGCRFDSRDDLIDDLMQKRFILCLGHDPDQRFGSRFADQHAT